MRDRPVEHHAYDCKVHIDTRATPDYSIVHDEVCPTVKGALDKIYANLSTLTASLNEHCKNIVATNARTMQRGDDRASKHAEKLESLGAVCSEGTRALRNAVDNSSDRLDSCSTRRPTG